MAKVKAVSNEEIIAALLQHGTIKEAAAAAGIAPRTIYDRMQDRGFKAAYMEAKNDIFRKAVYTINSRLSEAVDAVTDIMTDESVNAAVRLQAAQTIINNAQKFAARLSYDEEQSQRTAKPQTLGEILAEM